MIEQRSQYSAHYHKKDKIPNKIATDLPIASWWDEKSQIYGEQQVKSYLFFQQKIIYQGGSHQIYDHQLQKIIYAFSATAIVEVKSGR